MTPTKESGIARAATGTGTRFASMSGSSARVLSLVNVVFRSPGTAVCNQNLEHKKWKQKVAVRLSKKLGDIDSSPEASFISRYIPTLFVTFGTELDVDNIEWLASQNVRTRVNQGQRLAMKRYTIPRFAGSGV